MPAKQAVETGEKNKKRRRGRSSFAWFVAGLAISAAIVLGGILWNAFSEPRYVSSPPLNIFIQKFSGYILSAALIAIAIFCACLLRRRWAWLVPGGFVLAGAVVGVASTVLLVLGGGLACGKRQFETASPDGRLLVVAMRGNCGETTAFTYTVVVRELGPSFPRQSTIFKSFDGPIPTEVSFSTDRTLTLLTGKPSDKILGRYTVTIERKSLRPDKVWRFRRGPMRDGS
ncbi:MAG: hypothetical protein O7I42_01415 [Alphaproteobacteria bacterium]|nr:hypothetical protein [Alphaproteobacteria bacterium]